MFVIELIYKAGLPDIDAHMPEHMEFLRKHYAEGTFLVSGRKIPREGGIILAVGKSRAEVEAIARQDPFVAHGLAEVRGRRRRRCDGWHGARRSWPCSGRSGSRSSAGSC